MRVSVVATGIDAEEPAARPKPVLSLIVSRSRLMSDGSIEERQTRIYTGQYAAYLRSILQPLNQSDKQKWTLEKYHESVNNTVDPKFDFDGINDVRAPVTIRDPLPNLPVASTLLRDSIWNSSQNL